MSGLQERPPTRFVIKRLLQLRYLTHGQLDVVLAEYSFVLDGLLISDPVSVLSVAVVFILHCLILLCLLLNIDFIRDRG